MDEFVAGLSAIIEPVHYINDMVIIQPILAILNFWISFFSRYVLDSPLGHVFIRVFLGPLLSYILDRIYDCRKAFQLFEGMSEPLRKLSAGVASLCNTPLLNQPLKRIISNVGITYCGVLYGQQSREDAFLFFYLCNFVSGRIVGLDMGSGKLYDRKNSFFPEALKNGIIALGHPEDKDESSDASSESEDERTCLNVKMEDNKFIANRFIVADHKNQVRATFPERQMSNAEMVSSIKKMWRALGKSADGKTKLSGSMGDNFQAFKDALELEDPSTLQPPCHTEVPSARAGVIPEKPGTESKQESRTSSASFSSDSNSGNFFVKAMQEKDYGLEKMEKSNEVKNPEKNNLEIAMSCLLFSMLTYRTQKQLEQSMNQDMLPGVELFSSDTGSSGTQMIAFLDRKKKYAVFSYRGTEFEVMRQMLTSLDFRMEYFATGETPDSCQCPVECKVEKNRLLCPSHKRSHVRQVYMNEVKKSSELNKFHPRLDEEYLTPLELLKQVKHVLGFKVYITGHSLGGGLATVFAARLLSLGIDFDGLITFGATPVGDRNFVNWFNKKVPCSWRFMYGNEFAPMVPPIPWAVPTKDIHLKHVGGLYHFNLPPHKIPKTPTDADEVLDKLAHNTGMMDIFVHHNPMVSMNALKYFYYNTSTEAGDCLMLDVGAATD